jgi:hypothetical protein
MMDDKVCCIFLKGRENLIGLRGSIWSGFDADLQGLIGEICANIILLGWRDYIFGPLLVKDKVSEGCMEHGDRCLIIARDMDDGLEGDKSINDLERGDLKKFGEIGDGKWLGEERESENYLAEMGGVLGAL